MIEHIVVLQQIEDVLRAVLTFYHDRGVSWGWSIVLLTFTVRLAILPLTIKQFRSMAAMQRIQPKIKALQNRYKDKKDPEDRRKMQTELMALYKEHNVNPFASCLPLVFQMPVFIGLFRLLNSFASSNPKGSPAFLGIDNIFVKLSSIGGVTEYLIVGLYLASMLGSTLLFSFVADKQQKYLFAGMSIFFVFFIVNVPVGVGIYWITTNIWTICQQGIIKQTLGHHMPHLQKDKKDAADAKGGGGKAPAAPRKGSSRPKNRSGSGGPRPPRRGSRRR